MDPLQYLESLILGHKNSSIPVQLCELELLHIFLLEYMKKKEAK